MKFALDSAALLALIFNEPGAARVAAALPDCEILSVNLAEVVGKLVDKGMTPDLASETARGFGLTVAGFDAALAVEAGVLRNATRRAGLSLADRACLAFARSRGAVALTADRAWASSGLDVDVELIR